MNDRVTFIQESRAKAAIDNCRLFRFVILVAAGPGKRVPALAFIHKIHLDNCVAYATKTVSSQ